MSIDLPSSEYIRRSVALAIDEDVATVGAVDGHTLDLVTVG